MAIIEVISKVFRCYRFLLKFTVYKNSTKSCQLVVSMTRIPSQQNDSE